MDHICPVCGAPYTPGEKFCQNCGNRLPDAAPAYEAPAAPAYEAPAAPAYEAPAAPAYEAPAAPAYEAPAAPAYEAPAAPVYEAPAAPVPPAAPVYQTAQNYAPQQNVPNYAPTGAPNYAPKAAPVPPAAPNYAAPAYGAPAYAATPAAPKKKKTGLIVGLCVGAAVLIAAAIILYFFVLSPSSITLSAETATIEYYDSFQLTAEVSPGSALNKSVTWTSSDEDVATVYSDGTVTGWEPGTCVITATTSNGKSASCTVTVTVAPYMVSLSNYYVNLNVGETLTLTAEVYPDNATDKSVTWSSSDSSVATVSGGVVTAVGEGDCEITATTTNGVSESCSISVSAAEEPTDPTEPSVPNGIEDSAYDKFVVGEWKLVYYWDYENYEDVPVENAGLSGKIVFNADHTARITMNGESADYVWYFEEVDEYGDYCFWVENEGESLPFDYIVDEGDIWLYTDETTLTYQK